GGVAVEEVMLAGALPNEVPRVFLVHAQDTPPPAGGRLELARMLADDVALAEGYVVRVLARLRRHESDAIRAAIGGVAEPLNGRHIAALTLEPPADRDVGERVLRGG